MSPSTTAALLRAAQLAIAVWIAVSLKPGMTEALPFIPDYLVVFLVAVISALLVEVVSTFVLGRPELTVTWISDGDPKPLPLIDLKLSPGLTESLGFRVEATIIAKSFLARRIVKTLAESDIFIRVEMAASPVKPIVDRMARDADEIPLVTINNRRGLDIALRTETVPSSMWNWAELKFVAHEFPGDLTVDVKYSCAGSGAKLPISAKVLKVKSDVKKLRFRGV